MTSFAPRTRWSRSLAVGWREYASDPNSFPLPPAAVIDGHLIPAADPVSVRAHGRSQNSALGLRHGMAHPHRGMDCEQSPGSGPRFLLVHEGGRALVCVGMALGRDLCVAECAWGAGDGGDGEHSDHRCYVHAAVPPGAPEGEPDCGRTGDDGGDGIVGNTLAGAPPSFFPAIHGFVLPGAGERSRRPWALSRYSNSGPSSGRDNSVDEPSRRILNRKPDADGVRRGGAGEIRGGG